MNKITKILMSTLMIFGLASSVSVINDVKTVCAAETITKLSSDLATDGTADGVYVMTAVSGSNEYYVPNAKATARGEVVVKSFDKTTLKEDMYWNFSYSTANSGWEIQSYISTEKEPLFMNFIDDNNGVRVNNNKSYYTISLNSNTNDTKTFKIGAKSGKPIVIRNLAIYLNNGIPQDWRSYKDTTTSGIQNINLYKVTFTQESPEQEAVNAVTPMMSMGFKYTKETTLSDSLVTKYAKVTSVDELIDGTQVYLVGTNSDGKVYVAGSKNSTYLNAVEARISSDGYLNLPDNAKPLVVNAGYTLSYDTNFVGSDSDKNLTFGTTATNWSITLDAETSAATIVDTNEFPIMFNYNNGTNPRFKAYASKFTQGQLPTLYKAVEVEDVVSTYSNVDFRLKCGIDKTKTDALMDLEDADSYGIYVTAGETTKYFDVSVTTGYYEDTDASLYYVVISLGDVINYLERATTEFTIGAYVKKLSDSSYVLSDNTKVHSVASLVKTYYGMDEAKEYVTDLYNLFSDKGYYNA